jgi:YfiH family protein
MLIEAPELSSHSDLRHAFFTREGGVSEGVYASLNGGLGSSDDPARVRENRRRMTEQFGFPPEALVSLYQVHSATAIAVERPWSRDDRPKADGMATRTPGLALGISTADCGPVLFADVERCVVGAAHAGWKGALTGVLEATIAVMEELGAKRGDIVAVLGPTIGQAAYEVGPEFVARFVEADERNARFFRDGERSGHARFDLPGYIGHRLGEAGIGEFADIGLCTYADERRFFSYRRATHRGEADYGRLISAIALTP